VSIKEVLNENKGNLSVQLYVNKANNIQEHNIHQLLEQAASNQKELNSNIDSLFKQLKNLGIE